MPPADIEAEAVAAKSKLDNLGTVKNHAFVVNNPERMDKLRERYEVEASVATVHARKDKHKEADTTKLSNLMRSKLRRGLDLYTSGNHGCTFTMTMMHAIMHFAFGAPCNKQGSRADWLAELNALAAKDTSNLIEKLAGSVIPESVEEATPVADTEEAIAVADLAPLQGGECDIAGEIMSADADVDAAVEENVTEDIVH